jgi:hypothetical protein
MTLTATKANAHKVANRLEPYVNVLLLRKAYAQIEREKCDKIQRRLLATGSYGGDGNPKTVYRLPAEATNRYFADLDTAYREAGYRHLSPGYCPALIAEHAETEAEWALIKAAEEFFPGVTNDKLLCGSKALGGLETREKYLDLLIGLVVNREGYKAPTDKR